jgi:protein-tyrosine phosphatase
MFKVCFVCLGNICRSPLAQGVFEQCVRDEGLQDQIRVASAGTGSWHIGSPPDERMQETANRHGLKLNSRGRQFQSADFDDFDLILAMDDNNLILLEQLCLDPGKTENLKLFRSFDPEANGDLNVPDPYYGGGRGFEIVYDMVNRTCPKILDFIKARANLKA